MSPGANKIRGSEEWGDYWKIPVIWFWNLAYTSRRCLLCIGPKSPLWMPTNLLANKSTFQNLRERGQRWQVYTNFWKLLTANFCSIWFPLGIFGLIVLNFCSFRISAGKLSRDVFAGTICPHFGSSGIFSWMKSARRGCLLFRKFR